MFESLAQLLRAMRDAGADRFYAKPLAPNDNSKNQIYLGGDFSALNVLPHGEVEVDIEEQAGSIRERSKAPVSFFWIDTEGVGEAPGAQLILYPKYPEVRLSGFLRSAARAPADLLRSRDEGRVMIFGVCPDGRILGHVAADRSPVATRLATEGDLPQTGVFLDLVRLTVPAGRDPRTRLLEELGRIHRLGWIHGQRIGAGGAVVPYVAPNAGGYTLEAELGIAPNGVAEPDFHGWEVKQYGVDNFARMRPKSPVTLMTPEPTLGAYAADAIGFMHTYGYVDENTPGRVNFGGVYRNGGATHDRTRVRMVLSGFDAASGKIDSLDGTVALLDPADAVAAGWRFRDLLSHWNRKHSQAAYVPSMSRGTPKQYAFGDRVQLGSGTDFVRLLKLMASGTVYLDPALKLVDGRMKKRNQFRVRHADLENLYEEFETVPVL